MHERTKERTNESESFYSLSLSLFSLRPRLQFRSIKDKTDPHTCRTDRTGPDRT